MSDLQSSSPSRIDCSNACSSRAVLAAACDCGNADTPPSWSVVLPWPAGVLSPNGRSHWRVVAKAKKAHRSAAHILAMEAGANLLHSQLQAVVDAGQKIRVHLDFYPPNRRHHDDANVMHRCKAAIDGLADALGIDDRHFRTSYELMSQVGGFVRVTVTASHDLARTRVLERGTS